MIETTTTIKRIAIVNRGEPARRLIRAVRDYNLEYGTSIETAGLVTPCDEEAPFAREVDRVVPLTVAAGASASSAYLDVEGVIAAIRAADADSVWVGWGFLAEDARFAARVGDLGLTFIGPEPAAMLLAGDKIEAKRLAERVNVPVVPWSGKPVASLEEAAEVSARIGYPVALKAAAGGGGRGIRVAEAPESLALNYETASTEALRAFGDGRLFVERCIECARHIEVQIARDHRGHAVAFGQRDCTVQRRHQKVVEESPALLVGDDEGLAEDLERYALAIANGCGYRNLGTVEFIYDRNEGKPYFMEMNARLQVEHPVTELVYGIDLVKLQLDIARGVGLEGLNPQPRGHAIEVRLNAEDPDNDYAPAPGRVSRFVIPEGPGLRVDTGIAEGSRISPDFDSMVAKVIAHGSSRAEALARLRRALGEMAVIVEGGATNKTLLTLILAHPDFHKGDFDTRWLDTERSLGTWDERPYAAEALLSAAVFAYRSEGQRSLKNFDAAVAKGVPQRLPEADGREVKLNLRGFKATARVYCVGYRAYRVCLDQRPAVLVWVVDEGPGVARITVGAKRLNVLYEATEQSFYVEVEGIGHRILRDAGGMVRAPSPSLVMDLAVKVGDLVEAGDRLGSLEAMKMEMPLRAPHAGRVAQILVQRNSQVSAGQALMVLAPTGNGELATAPERAIRIELPTAPDPFLDLFDGDGVPRSEIFNASAKEVRLSCAEAVRAELCQLFLGYDLDQARLDLLSRLLDAETLWEELEHGEEYLALGQALMAFAHSEAVFSNRLLRPHQGDHAVSLHTAFYSYCRRLQSGEEGAHPELAPAMRDVLAHYGIDSLAPCAQLRHAVARLAVSHGRDDARAELKHRLVSTVLRVIIRLFRAGARFGDVKGLYEALEQTELTASRKWPFVADNAYQARYAIFYQRRYERHAKEVAGHVRDLLERAGRLDPQDPKYSALVDELVCVPETVFHLLAQGTRSPSFGVRRAAAESLYRRLYESDIAAFHELRVTESDGGFLVLDAVLRRQEDSERVLAVIGTAGNLRDAAELLGLLLREGDTAVTVADLMIHRTPLQDAGEVVQELETIIDGLPTKRSLARVCCIVINGAQGANGSKGTNGATRPGLVPHYTLVPDDAGRFSEVRWLRFLHPETERRLDLWRLSEFDLTRSESHERLVIYHGRAKQNPADERVFVIGEVRDAPEMQSSGHEGAPSLMAFEHAYMEAVRALREIQSRRSARARYHWNRVVLYVRPPVVADRRLVVRVARSLGEHTVGLGLERVVVRAPVIDPKRPDSDPVDTEIHVSNPTGHKVEVRFHPPSQKPIPAATPYELKVRRSRSQNVPYPYEIIRMLTSEPGVVTLPEAEFPPGRFTEYDLHGADSARAVPLPNRPYGDNIAGIVFGVISNQTAKHPEGMERVIVLSDPLKNMGALAEPECARIIAALDLAAERRIPVEWVPVSSGARIAMDSGTENLDWTARVLRRIIEFTQSGGEINLIVDGVNVGAQSYFNAESTMLMHTRGVLIMTPRGAMVLTGKRALDYSGGVSAEDERGIGGYERIMGANGQAQYFARDLADAFEILFEHYSFTYIAPGECAVRPHQSNDSVHRDPSRRSYSSEADESFECIGDIFSTEHNPERKKPFSMRAVMRAVIDRDGGQLERFAEMRQAETSIVWDCHLGGESACLIGFECRPLPRPGYVPGDGPDTWTGGTLFPLSSKKVARAINAASGRRPVVVLANLSGFDGSPDSMRNLQLEYGAEIGRAVVNFDGPIVFCVIARYHGGAYVVFSKALNPRLHALALEGSYASVIGGAPAAAVVFPREVRARTQADERVKQARTRLENASTQERPRLREENARTYADVYADRQGEVARRFDEVHSVQRACEVGSLDEVISSASLRARVIAVLKGEAAAQQGSDRQEGVVRDRAGPNRASLE